MKRIRQWFSVNSAKRPNLVILLVILFVSLLLFVFATVVIIKTIPVASDEQGLGSRISYTISLIRDSGSVQYIIEELNDVNLILVVLCLATDFVSLIVFNGAIIGYATNLVSQFIEDADSDSKTLKLQDHVVILNWNNRGSEIINSYLYEGKNHNIIVLQSGDKKEVQQEITENIADTIRRENKTVIEKSKTLAFWQKQRYISKHSIRNKLSIIVRNGQSFSAQQLNDISLPLAKSIIILSKPEADEESNEELLQHNRGNINTIKTLIQVAQLCSEENSIDNQKIIVEIEDEWTAALVDRIIKQKMKENNDKIVAFEINRILGYILFQICIMPELNLVYSELFSNSGAEFYALNSAELVNDRKEGDFITSYLSSHNQAVPVTTLIDKFDIQQYYFLANHKSDILKTARPRINPDFKVAVNKNFTFKEKQIIILGHNSKCEAIMDGFDSFRNEWQLPNKQEILNVIIVDDQESLESFSYYREYPYVKQVLAVDFNDSDSIYSTISELVKAKHDVNTSILILSDDAAPAQEIDTNALTYLIYLQDIIADLKEADPAYDTSKINIIVEILDPRNRDVVNNYDVDTLVISNHFISEMIGQLSESETLFDFYIDMLTYDEAIQEEQNVTISEGNELYIKPVKDFFEKIPETCLAIDLIKSVYTALMPENPTIVLGYFKADGQLILFDDDLDTIKVSLNEDDKLVVFANH